MLVAVLDDGDDRERLRFGRRDVRRSGNDGPESGKRIVDNTFTRQHGPSERERRVPSLPERFQAAILVLVE